MYLAGLGYWQFFNLAIDFQIHQIPKLKWSPKFTKNLLVYGTVGVGKKFPFCFRSTIVLRCERTLNYGVKSLLCSRIAYRFYGFNCGKIFEHL